MKAEFPEYFGGEEVEEEAEPEQQPARRASPVAAPTRTVNSSGVQKPSHKISLNADEVRFVTRMVENGGGPKYPQGHPKQFTPMSLTGAYKGEDRHGVPRYPNGPWCRVGDWIMIPRQSSFLFQYKGVAMATLTDDKVMGILKDPRDVSPIYVAPRI